MDDSWNKRFLLKAKVGHVASIYREQPFIVPTSFWYSEKKNERVVNSKDDMKGSYLGTDFTQEEIEKELTILSQKKIINSHTNILSSIF